MHNSRWCGPAHLLTRAPFLVCDCILTQLQRALTAWLIEEVHSSAAKAGSKGAGAQAEATSLLAPMLKVGAG